MMMQSVFSSDFQYADPVISLLFVILIMISVLKLFKASSMIMLLSIPKGFHVEEVTDTIYEKFPDISNIHEVSWIISSLLTNIMMQLRDKSCKKHHKSLE